MTTPNQLRRCSGWRAGLQSRCTPGRNNECSTPVALPDALDLVWFQTDGRSPKQARLAAECHFSWRAGGVSAKCVGRSPTLFSSVLRAATTKLITAIWTSGAFVLDGGGVRWALDARARRLQSPGLLRLTALVLLPHRRNRTTPSSSITKARTLMPRPPSAHTCSRRISPGWKWISVTPIAVSKVFTAPHRYRAGPAGIHSRCAGIEQPVEALWGMLTDADVSSRRAERRTPKEWVDAIRGNPHTPACGF